MKDVNKKIKNLRKSIEKHNYQYYVLNEPLITDSEWDKLFKNLEKIEKKYPILIHLPQSYPINIKRKIEKIKIRLI